MKRKFSLRIFQIVLIIIISAMLGYVIGTYKLNVSWRGYKPIVGISNQMPPLGQDLNMTLFYDVVDRLNATYYDKSKIDSQKMLNGAISGMLQSLGDPYTSFFAPKENENFKTQLAGEFSGIGAELSVNEQGEVVVVAPIDGSPAERAGIKTGDLILKVDDKITAGWTIGQAVEHIRGHKGTKVELTILHEKEKTPKVVSIVRDTIQVKSVTSWIKNFNCSGGSCKADDACTTCASVGYIRLSQFGDKTNDEWLQAVNKMVPLMKEKKNFKGLILDVRNNPGGYLNDAVYIASEFIKTGNNIVLQRDGTGNTEALAVTRTGVLLDTPMVVLVNKGSASASEILSGALQDYGRAKVMGEQSFGKGTVQQAVDLTGGGSVHISIAKWLTPKERWVHGKGLTPDIEIKYDASASSKLKSENLDNQIEAAIKQLSR